MIEPSLVADSIPANSNETRPGAAPHPLGPLIHRVAPHRTNSLRALAAGVFAASATILAVAGTLVPDRSGMGSHRQLGLPPCTSVVLFGYPCPTCGMTTAFAHTVRGQLVAAFRAQPAGLILALATIASAIGSLGALLTGRTWTVNWYRVSPTRVVIVAVVLILGGWLYKVVSGVASGVFPTFG